MRQGGPGNTGTDYCNRMTFATHHAADCTMLATHIEFISDAHTEMFPLFGVKKESDSRAFPIRVGYNFGKNKGERKFAMTAPVTQTAAPVKMELTAPGTQAAVPGGMRVQFVLPEGVTLESAPDPLDPRVQLRQVPASQWATIRYSGTWSQANYDEHLGKLQAALAAAGVATQGQPVLARYNSPMTPWFMRRNEIWLALR